MELNKAPIFNIDKAKAGEPVVTREGIPVSIYSFGTVYIFGHIGGDKHRTYWKLSGAFHNRRYPEKDLFTS